MTRKPVSRPFLSALVAASASLAAAGCGGGAPPAQSSPAVSADSEAGIKAIAEDDALRRQRQEQEAQARKRFRGLPTEG